MRQGNATQPPKISEHTRSGVLSQTDRLRPGESSIHLIRCLALLRVL
jgi:hypothetical protein